MQTFIPIFWLGLSATDTTFQQFNYILQWFPQNGRSRVTKSCLSRLLGSSTALMATNSKWYQIGQIADHFHSSRHQSRICPKIHVTTAKHCLLVDFQTVSIDEKMSLKSPGNKSRGTLYIPVCN